MRQLLTLQHPPEITFGANLFDWSEATVADLQKTKWAFAGIKEMRKVRSPCANFLRENVAQITPTGCMTAVVHANSRGHDLAGRGWGPHTVQPQAKGSALFAAMVHDARIVDSPPHLLSVDHQQQSL
jgi:hypothetical protein